MHIAADFADGQFGALGKGQLRQQFGDIGADHLGTEQFAVFGVGDDFDEPGVISEAEGLAVGLEGEAPDLDGVTLFLGLGFGDAKRGHLGMAVDGAGHHAVIEFDGFDPGDGFGADDALGGGDMGQKKLAGDVANGPDAGDVGGHTLVDLNETALGELDTGGFEADVGGVGFETDGDEGLVGFEDLFGVGGADFDLDAFIGTFNGEDFVASENLHAAFGVDFSQFIGHFFIFGGKNMREHFNNGHLAAVAVPDGGEFDANGAAADDDNIFRAGGLQDGFSVSEDAFAVDDDARDGHGIGPGGDDDIFGSQFLDLAFGTGDADLVFGEQFGGAHVHVNFVFLHQRADAQGEAF